MQLYHSSGNSFVANSTGVLVLQGNGSGQSIKINPKSGENSIVCIADGATNLYHNNVMKLNTESYGVTVQDDLKVQGAEGSHAQLRLVADEGDDNADNWMLRSETDGAFYLKNYTDGACETNLKSTGGGTVSYTHLTLPTILLV